MSRHRAHTSSSALARTCNLQAAMYQLKPTRQQAQKTTGNVVPSLLCLHSVKGYTTWWMTALCLSYLPSIPSLLPSLDSQAHGKQSYG